MALETLLIGAGLAKGAGALAKGIGSAVSAKRSFSPEEERRLRELMRRRREGSLGLTQREEALLRTQGAGQLEAQAAAGEQATLRSVAGAAGSGRDLFLARMAEQRSAQEATRALNQEVAKADEVARQEQRAELRDLMAQRAKARAGIVEAVGGTAAGVAEAGAGAALGLAELEKAKAEAAIREDADLIKQSGLTKNAGTSGGGLNEALLRELLGL